MHFPVPVRLCIYHISTGTLNTIAPGSAITMQQNGYLYIWVSNETQGWDVFFDNLSVQHRQGPVLEENHYYPGGLSMAGISDKALKANYAENKYRFGGKELQHQDFSDGSGLEEYDFGARLQDPQLMVWHNPDPLADNNRRWSPYAYGNDNPLRFIDPDGMEGEDVTNSQMDQQLEDFSNNQNQVNSSLGDASADGANRYEACASCNIKKELEKLLEGDKDDPWHMFSSRWDNLVDQADDQEDDFNGKGPHYITADAGATGREKRIKSETGGDEIDDPTRNPAQDKKLTPDEIEKLKEHGWDHSNKPKGRNAPAIDLYKDRKGNVYEKPQGGNGYGVPIGININNLFSTPPAGGMSPAAKVSVGVGAGIAVYLIWKAVEFVGSLPLCGGCAVLSPL